MVLDEMKFYFDNEDSSLLIGNYLKPYFYDASSKRDTIVVCIGTDKCIGDCLGPLVGTILTKNNFPFPVYGTLKEPIHAVNLRERLDEIQKKHPLAFIIAVDACLGEVESVGSIQIRESPIFPGKGVGKSLPSVGDVSLIGIVDGINKDNGFNLHSIRLSFVMEMAEIIAEGLIRGTK